MSFPKEITFDEKTFFNTHVLDLELSHENIVLTVISMGTLTTGALRAIKRNVIGHKGNDS